MRPLRDWGYRLYKVSLPSALILSSPLLVAVGWYAWSAFAQYDRYARAFDEPESLNAEMVQLFLHDELRRDLRRLLLPERPTDSPLPTFELFVPRESLDTLAAVAGHSEGKYVKASLRAEGAVHPVKVRFRGRRHWHWLGAQKSMKIRTKKGDLVAGVRVFNLINDVTPFGLEEELILELARELGLLTPEYRPVWLRLNNAGLGVYRFAAQPAEGLLRRGSRMPGSVYSGNADSNNPPGGVGPLWADLDGWAKSAAKTPAEEEDFAELELLLEAINRQSHAGFRDFARDRLDLDRLATYDALDVVFGGDQHDFLSNHKLYFDPYRGRFEPIAWNVRGFAHDPLFNRVDNPLLMRLKALPEYLPLRDKKVYELLVGRASTPTLRDRVDRRFAELLDDLEADPYWDAYKLLPRASRFHRFMVRPMSAGRWLLASRDELAQISRRSRFLLDALERPSLAASWSPVGANLVRIDLTVDGFGAYELQAFTLEADCAGTYAVFADSTLDGQLTAEADARLAVGAYGEAAATNLYNRLVPGIRLVPRDDPAPKRGAVRSERQPRLFTYFVQTRGCTPTGGTAHVESLVTGGSMRLRLAPPTGRTAPMPMPASTVPRLQPGETSPHPWSFGRESLPAVEIRLGPQPIQVHETMTYESFQTVRIAAGTRIKVAPGASLVFKGPVFVDGTASQPVEIRSRGPAPFAGLLLVGPDTAGSELRHLTIVGGTRPQLDAMYTPGLVNIYDTRDVLLEHVTIEQAVDVDDVVHATYVERLRLHELRIHGAPMDAVDIEMSTAEIRGARLVAPGDECIDLMGSTVRLADSVLLGCPSNAISAGEESDLTVHGVVVADTDVAVLAKNASTVRVSRSLLYRAKRALRTNRRDVYYDDASFIGAQDIFAVDCAKLTRVARRTRVETGVVHRSLPEDGVLDYVRRQVLGIDDWQQLDRRLTELTAGGPR